MRPAYGFAMQAIGPAGASASDIGRRLGVTKQAAGKTVDRLVTLGYAERADDPADARRKLIRLTPHSLTPWPARPRSSTNCARSGRLRWAPTACATWRTPCAP